MSRNVPQMVKSPGTLLKEEDQHNKESVLFCFVFESQVYYKNQLNFSIRNKKEHKFLFFFSLFNDLSSTLGYIKNEEKLQHFKRLAVI